MDFIRQQLPSTSAGVIAGRALSDSRQSPAPTRSPSCALMSGMGKGTRRQQMSSLRGIGCFPPAGPRGAFRAALIELGARALPLRLRRARAGQQLDAGPGNCRQSINCCILHDSVPFGASLVLCAFDAGWSFCGAEGRRGEGWGVLRRCSCRCIHSEPDCSSQRQHQAGKSKLGESRSPECHQMPAPSHPDLPLAGGRSSDPVPKPALPRAVRAPSLLPLAATSPLTRLEASP